jgi:hypothetical protein
MVRYHWLSVRHIHRIYQRMRRYLSFMTADDDYLVMNQHSLVKPSL